MECPQCHFHNIPGQTRCLQCGSALVIEQTGRIHPPRMPAWKRPWRGLVRLFRRSFARYLPRINIPRFVDPTGSLLLSVIPGLGHLNENKFRDVRWLVLGWGVCLLLGIFLFGSLWAAVLLGLAIGLHAWIALHAGLWHYLAGLAERLMALLVVLLVTGLLYAGGLEGSQHLLGLRIEAIPFDSPLYNLHRRDILLLRRLDHDHMTLKPGDLVRLRLPRMRVGGGRVDALITDRRWSVGQVVGLPGQSVRIDHNRFIVNGQSLDPGDFPVPSWMACQETFHLDQKSYFMRVAYRVRIRDNGIRKAIIREVCICTGNEIQSRAIWQWMPLVRRGPLP